MVIFLSFVTSSLSSSSLSLLPPLKESIPDWATKSLHACACVSGRVRSYDGGIKSLERSALRLKRKSTQNFCVTKSSTHVIPKMMSKSMWGEEMKCEIGIGASLRSLLRRHWRAAHSMMKWKEVSGAIKHSHVRCQSYTCSSSKYL